MNKEVNVSYQIYVSSFLNFTCFLRESSNSHTTQINIFPTESSWIAKRKRLMAVGNRLMEARKSADEVQIHFR